MSTRPRSAIHPFGPARPSSFVDQVYGRILSQIVDGTFETGSKLPSEKDLGERFGVSRPVVRDALSRLQRDGLVEARKGSGSFVLARPPHDLSAAADLDRIARYQRYQEFRLVVEGTAAALAAERRSEAALAGIVAAHERFVEEMERGVFRWESDRAVHLAIAEATGNEFFAEGLEGPDVRLGDFMTVSLKLTSSRSPQRMQIVAQEHANIVEAIRLRDRTGARVAMEYHIVQARRRMLDRTIAP